MVGEQPRPGRRSARRKRLLTRAAPIGGVAVLAFAVGVVAATAPGRAERRLVTRYVSAWAKGDYPSMYSMLDTSSRARTSEAEFAAGYRAAATTATLVSIAPGHVGNRVGSAIPVPVRVTGPGAGVAQPDNEPAATTNAKATTCRLIFALELFIPIFITILSLPKLTTKISR